jgi:hypothetical protein
MPKKTLPAIVVNLNDHVLVRLTSHGLKKHRKQYDALAACFGGRLSWKYTRPKVDADGWSRWQLHDLIRTFGPVMPFTASPLPFEPEIRIEAGQVLAPIK